MQPVCPHNSPGCDREFAQAVNTPALGFANAPFVESMFLACRQLYLRELVGNWPMSLVYKR